MTSHHWVYTLSLTTVTYLTCFTTSWNCNIHDSFKYIPEWWQILLCVYTSNILPWELTFINQTCEAAVLSLPRNALERVHVKHIQATAGPVVIVSGTVFGAACDPRLVVTHALQTRAGVPGKHLSHLIFCPCNIIDGTTCLFYVNSRHVVLRYLPSVYVKPTFS